MAAQKNYAVWVYGLVLELFLTTIEASVLVFTCCKQTETVSRPGCCTSDNNSGLCCSSKLSRLLRSVEVRINTCSTGTGFSVRPSVFHGQYHFNSVSHSPSSLDLKGKADKAWGPSYSCGAFSETGEHPERKFFNSLLSYVENYNQWGVRLDISVCIATRSVLDGPGMESRWGRDFTYPSRPALGLILLPKQWVALVWNLGGYIFTIAYIYTVLLV
jgi:hypothetical protein